jgi:hypothetical protein
LGQGHLRVNDLVAANKVNFVAQVDYVVINKKDLLEDDLDQKF